MSHRLVPAIVVFVLLAAGMALTPGGHRPAAANPASPAAGTPCAATTADENAALVRRFIEEVWGRGDPAAVDAVVAPEFIGHLPRLARYFPATPQAAPPGPAGLKAAMHELHTDYPDLRITIDDLIVAGDTVAARMTWSGTQADPFQIWGAPNTGRRMEQQTMAFWRISCGKISELWVQHDDLTLLRQLGIVTDDELRTAGTPTVATPVP